MRRSAPRTNAHRELQRSAPSDSTPTRREPWGDMANRVSTPAPKRGKRAATVSTLAQVYAEHQARGVSLSKEQLYALVPSGEQSKSRVAPSKAPAKRSAKKRRRQELRDEPPPGFTERDVAVARAVIGLRARQHAIDATRDRIERAQALALAELLASNRAAITDIADSARLLADKYLERPDVARELEELEERLYAVRDVDRRAGLVAQTLRAMRLACANDQEMFLRQVHRASASFMSNASASWKGMEVFKAAWPDLDVMNANGSYLPGDLETSCEELVSEALERGWQIPENPFALVAPRGTPNVWSGADSLTLHIVSSAIGAVDEEHAAAGLDAQKMSVRLALAKLGKKKRNDARAIVRAAFKAVGYSGSLFKREDQKKSRARRKLVTSRNVTKRMI